MRCSDWGGATVGRFLGSTGLVALAVGPFNSVMFPVIVPLTPAGSNAFQVATCGPPCFAISDGALPPLIAYLCIRALAVAAGRLWLVQAVSGGPRAQ